MARLGCKIADFDLIEINEAFASQGLACLRQLGVADDAEHVNPHGGAIALGHPLGMSGARITLTAVHGLEKRGGKRAWGGGKAKVVPVARLSMSAMFIWHQFSMKKFDARSLHLSAMKP